MREWKTVSVADRGPDARVRSTDAFVPRSGLSGRGTDSRDRPAASVSSVIAVGAKKPRPNERRLDH